MSYHQWRRYDYVGGGAGWLGLRRHQGWESSSDVRFGPNVGQIGPKWDKSGTYSDQIRAKMY